MPRQAKFYVHSITTPSGSTASSPPRGPFSRAKILSAIAPQNSSAAMWWQLERPQSWPSYCSEPRFSSSSLRRPPRAQCLLPHLASKTWTLMRSHLVPNVT